MTLTVTVCPVCDETLDLDENLELSEVVVCDHCDAELEVEAVDPFVLRAFEEEEK
jgi:lysine biosynthesis protein LysW